MRTKFFVLMALVFCSHIAAAESKDMGVKRLSDTQLSIEGSQPFLNVIESLVSGSARNYRIVDGWPAEAGQLPWQVALLAAVISDNERAQFCGGTLVSDTWVVTAAHCVDGGTKAHQVEILAGEISLRSSNAERIPIKNIIIHSAYNRTTMDSDIALLELIRPATGENITPIKPISASKESEVSSSVPLVVSGWGAIYESGPSSPVLLGADVTIVDRASCNSESMYSGEITEAMICAGRIPGGGVDSCQGDSGGPLVLIDEPTKLVGVVSWGYGCARPLKPGVYTRVSSFLDWINTNLGD